MYSLQQQQKNDTSTRELRCYGAATTWPSTFFFAIFKYIKLFKNEIFMLGSWNNIATKRNLVVYSTVFKSTKSDFKPLSKCQNCKVTIIAASLARLELYVFFVIFKYIKLFKNEIFMLGSWNNIAAKRNLVVYSTVFKSTKSDFKPLSKCKNCKVTIIAASLTFPCAA